MAKKNIKALATDGASVFNQIADGNAKDVQSVQDVQNTQGAQDVDKKPAVRLNLKIPAEIKEYLQAAAYRESNAKHTVSITEYLCNLVRADMEKNNDQ